MPQGTYVIDINDDGIDDVVFPMFKAYGTGADTSTKYGHFFPDLGLIVLSEKVLSASIAGTTGSLNSGSGYIGGGSGLAPELNNDATADNAWKFARSIQLGTLTFRSEEDQLTESYFCRATAPDFNFSYAVIPELIPPTPIIGKSSLISV